MHCLFFYKKKTFPIDITEIWITLFLHKIRGNFALHFHIHWYLHSQDQTYLFPCCRVFREENTQHERNRKMCLKIMQGLSFLSQVLIYSYFRVNDLFLSKPPSTKSLTQKSSSYISELMIKIQTSLFCLMGNEPLVVRDGIYWTHPLLPLMFQTQLPQLRRHRGPGPAHGSLPFDKLIHC